MNKYFRKVMCFPEIFLFKGEIMDFDALCDMVMLGEADVDSLTGRDKVFSLADDAEDLLMDIDLDDIKQLIKQTVLPFTKDYITSLVLNDLMDYMPAETSDLKVMLKRNIWAKFDDSEKKSERAAGVFFAWLKKKKLVLAGIPKKEIADADEPTDKELRELEKSGGVKDVDVDAILAKLRAGETKSSGRIGMSDVESLGGRVDDEEFDPNW